MSHESSVKKLTNIAATTYCVVGLMGSVADRCNDHGAAACHC